MKKQHVLKLKLNRETLRELGDRRSFGQAKELNAGDLKQVAGQRPNPTISCWGEC
jgi:hypothetical protein